MLHLSFPLALHPHLVNPWPPQTETLLTALCKDISEVLSTVSLSKNWLTESSNWFLVHEPNNMPPDVPSLQPLCTLSVKTAITFLGSLFPLSTFGIGIRTFCPISTSVNNLFWSILHPRSLTFKWISRLWPFCRNIFLIRTLLTNCVWCLLTLSKAREQIYCKRNIYKIKTRHFTYCTLNNVKWSFWWHIMDGIIGIYTRVVTGLNWRNLLRRILDLLIFKMYD